jgi:Holliday junction DNA helicase RuvB
VGLKTISAVVGEKEDTIQDVYEPFLIRQGFLERTARGRVITGQGLEVIGLGPDEAGEHDEQQSIF